MIVIMLIVNFIIIKNIIIASFSSTYKFYSNKKLGLYYETIVSKFPHMKFDEYYGAICCAPPIFNLFLVPLWPVTQLSFMFKNPEKLKKYNLFLCKIVYLPTAITLTFAFFILDFVLFPLAYFNTILTLI